mmetsp:Transcript_42662/g.51230  ORF Transcript_42662/g.51230 Transcript_42662/m.51230 type:complete len:88 (+) Transcript_42662:82-345(+)
MGFLAPHDMSDHTRSNDNPVNDNDTSDARLCTLSTGQKSCNDSAFCFPPTIPVKQQWKLLGNSLNVKVASKVAEIGLVLALKRGKIR